MTASGDRVTTGPGPCRMRWGRRLALAATLALVLGGCTAGFVYNRLDWVVSWYVNGVVSLDGPQERQLKDIVRRTLQWHRETQIPAYLDLLQQIERESAEPVTAQSLERHYQTTTIMMEDFLRRVVPEAAALLRTLSVEQVAELQQNLEEQNEELWEEYGGTTPAIRQKRRNRSAVRVMQRFTGRLAGSQRALIETHLAQMHDVSEQWLERRRHWQDRFVALLRDRPPEPDFAVALLDMALNPNQFDTPDYRERVESNRAVIMVMLAELVNSLGERQRGRLQRKLRGYAEDLREIQAAG